MRHAHSLLVLSGLLALTVAGCSGSGGTDTTSSVRIPCAGGENFCLSSCDLGCSQTGCSITEIAENQRLRFVFSDRLAPASVNNSSVSIRTVTGVAPDGDLLVEQNVLTFVPRVRTINGVSTFGFQRNETYIISFPGGAAAPFGVSSVSGGRLTREFSCTVVASRGITDEDQLPPHAEMVTPTDLNAAPLDPTIVLRFSELIDTTPLRGALTPSSPIQYTLRHAVPNGAGLDCVRDEDGTPLLGIPRLSTETVGDHDVTVVTFKPTVQLPGLSCVNVVVTADLRDLSGRPATPSTFEFFTREGVSVPLTFTESFVSPAGREEDVSGGTWNNGARPGLIGGDGRHGSFDPATVSGTSSLYRWDTTQIVIPDTQSLTGQQYVVTDGKFYFTDFFLPSGVTVDFVGPVPPQIFVRGKATINGTITLNGVAMTDFDGRGGTLPTGPFMAGQAGGIGGAGGGRGGKGGDECPATGTLNLPAYSGVDGEPVKLLAGHAYAGSAAGTGGHGGTLFPADGLRPPLPTNGGPPVVANLYNPFFSSGGSGGGFSSAGGTFAVTTTIANLQFNAAPIAGAAFPLFPFPPVSAPTGYSALNHFLIGGSGGGGGGSHGFTTYGIINTQDAFVAGAGGSGGGGAFALRAGNDLMVGNAAHLEAKGGAGALIQGHTSGLAWGLTSPGGGGSGGSFLLQSGRNLDMFGGINTSGGDGSRIANSLTSTLATLACRAGAGSPGFYRLEAGGTVNVSPGANTMVPAYNAANNSGTLIDRDTFSGCTSVWRSSNLVFPPQWLRYELDVDTDGNGTTDVTFTDNGASGTQVANDINGPVVIQFQGGVLEQGSTQPTAGTVGPWRYGIGNNAVPGIASDSAMAFRFMMTFNRGAFPNCVVKALRVYART